MPLHPQAKFVLDLVNSFDDPPLEQQTPAQAREIRASRRRPSNEPVHEIRDVDAGGVAARLYRPSADDGLGLLVFLHGGGWVIGDLDSHDNVCRTLANGSGHAILSVDYRLAPEFPFPSALDDAVAATRWAHASVRHLGCRSDRIAIGGDSAGGNLAAVVAQLAPVPLVFQLLVYPVTDCTRSHQSHVENAEGYFLSTTGMQWFIDHYIASTGTEPKDPRVSPLYASDVVLSATPPALVITAEFDPGMFHGFFSLADFLDDGKSANALAAAALKAALSR